MSLNVDDDDHKPTAHFPSIPLDLNGNEITWDQNFANALGRISRLMNEASDAEAAKIRAYLASAS